MKKPKITLFSITENPIQCICLGVEAWHSSCLPETSDSIDLMLGKRMQEEKFRSVLRQPHQTPFEFVNTVWVMKNVSRAFQQQLTRHRVGFSYSIQSLRVVEQKDFADKRRYHTPLSLKKPEAFHAGMLAIQKLYNDILGNGEKAEDARGVLPLNIYSPITMSCSYRALLGLIKQRLCVEAQYEWREVVEQMRSEMYKVDPILAEPMDCACGRFAKGTGICKITNNEVSS